MSGDRIELTDSELEVAAEAAYMAHAMQAISDGRAAPWGNLTWSQPKWRLSIDAALAAVNRARAGDPVGTIRRATDHSGYEIRVPTDQGLRWRVVNLLVGEDSWLSDRSFGTWPVVYSPEES